MLASFRRLSKSRLGTAILVAFVVAIAISFAATDISNIAPGGFGSRGEVARVGSKSLTEQDISAAIDQQLSRLRQENPQVQRADLLRNFDQIVNGLVQEMAVTAFAERHDIALSRRLVDAEIANIPAVRGLDGRFNPQSYAAFLQQQRMTDAQLRGIISNGLLQRLVLAPGVANSRIATGVAQPYASMLLEQREGELVAVPIDLFRKDLNPNDGDLRRYFAENRARYTIPEQRVIRYAVISPENVASAAATEQEIAAAYNADRAKYAPRQLRDISQAVVPDRQTAQAIATRARAGSSFAQAAAPAGLSAADVAIGVQSRDQFESLAGAEVAAAAFAAKQGAIVGPLQSELGWHVVRIDAVRDEAGTPLAQVRDEIAARLTADKRKNALTDLITAIEDEVADGASFADMVAKYRLTAAQTPPLTASGVAPSDRAFRLPPAASNVLKAAFESAPDDDARVETFGQGHYALVATEQVIEPAPPPLKKIAGQLRSDWISAKAAERAKLVAEGIAARVARGTPLNEAARASGARLPPPQPIGGRRLQLAQFQGRVPPPLIALFSLPQGKSRLVSSPQNRAFFIVQVKKVTAGNASMQPALIARTQAEFGEMAQREYAEQLVNAIQAGLKIKLNKQEMARVRQQLSGGAS